MFKWIFSGVYVLGLLLSAGASIVSRSTKRKLLSKILSIVATFLMVSWAVYTFVLSVRADINPTFFDALYITIVALNVVFYSVLFVLAILGELDLCPDSNASSEDEWTTVN